MIDNFLSKHAFSYNYKPKIISHIVLFQTLTTLNNIFILYSWRISIKDLTQEYTIFVLLPIDLPQNAKHATNICSVFINRNKKRKRGKRKILNIQTPLGVVWAESESQQTLAITERKKFTRANNQGTSKHKHANLVNKRRTIGK